MSIYCDISAFYGMQWQDHRGKLLGSRLMNLSIQQSGKSVASQLFNRRLRIPMTFFQQMYAFILLLKCHILITHHSFNLLPNYESRLNLPSCNSFLGISRILATSQQQSITSNLTRHTDSIVIINQNVFLLIQQLIMFMVWPGLHKHKTLSFDPPVTYIILKVNIWDQYRFSGIKILTQNCDNS